jgi:hypothetical protein
LQVDGSGEDDNGGDEVHNVRQPLTFSPITVRIGRGAQLGCYRRLVPSRLHLECASEFERSVLALSK